MLYEITVPQFTKMLYNLGQILDKADAYATANKFDVSILLNDRLTPNMFNFTRQVQAVCDTAKKCTAYLTGKEAPTNDDSEKTIEELKNRIQQTIGFLETVSEKDFEGSESRHVSQPRWEGKYLTGKEFVIQHALPNFYFHTTTAYAILRKSGVDIGKRNYLGEMPYKK